MLQEFYLEANPIATGCDSLATSPSTDSEPVSAGQLVDSVNTVPQVAWSCLKCKAPTAAPMKFCVSCYQVKHKTVFFRCQHMSPNGFQLPSMTDYDRRGNGAYLLDQVAGSQQNLQPGLEHTETNDRRQHRPGMVRHLPAKLPYNRRWPHPTCVQFVNYGNPMADSCTTISSTPFTATFVLRWPSTAKTNARCVDGLYRKLFGYLATSLGFIPLSSHCSGQIPNIRPGFLSKTCS